MQDSLLFDSDELPCSCPSYTESSIVDQAVPFIIFLSKYSKLQDRLSATAELERQHEHLLDRIKSQRFLLRVLDNQLAERQSIQSWRQTRAWTANLYSVFRKSASSEKQESLEHDCAEIMAKKAEVETMVADSQREIDRVMEGLAERDKLQSDRLRQQDKLDRIYQNVFGKGKAEYTEERAASSAVASAVAWSESCSERLSEARNACELLEEALSHAVYCYRALQCAQLSRTQSVVMPAASMQSYISTLRRALAHEKSLLVFLQLARALDPQIAPSVRLPILGTTLEPILSGETSHRHNNAGLGMWSAGAEIYARVSDLLPAVQLAARSLSREHARLSACVQHYKRQLSQSQIRVTRAQEVQRNARRTIFIDTLLGRDSKVDPAIDQDPYTLFKWLKDADEAGRLSVPTSAALSAATKQSDRDDLPEY